jgi:predicted transcriptional regulator
MTQSRKKKPTVDQVLKLVDQLSAEEREQLIQELRTEDFRREIQKGVDAADRGELAPAEEVLARLRSRAQSRL